MDDISVPIDVESNGEELVEIDSKHAKKHTTIHTSLCEPMADRKPLKR